MAEINSPCWQCELCGHVWLKTGDDPPPQCSKCKKRNWNMPPDAALGGVAVVVHPLAPASSLTVIPPPPPTITNAATTAGMAPKSSLPERRQPKRDPRCPRCGRPVMQWGSNMLRCEPCAANWTPEQAGCAPA